MIISQHCTTQAQMRHLQSELDAGIRKIEASIVDSSIRGELNFIVERKRRVLNRKGSSGDLVIIGIDWDRKVVKSIFLQRSKQVQNRIARGKQYQSLLK